jgi:hypothetical protein
MRDTFLLYALSDWRKAVSDRKLLGSQIMAALSQDSCKPTMTAAIITTSARRLQISAMRRNDKFRFPVSEISTIGGNVFPTLSLATWED